MKVTSREIRFSGENFWFHPSFCPRGENGFLFSGQRYLGSDLYGAPLYAAGSLKDGRFSVPAPIPSFAVCETPDGLLRRIFDVRIFDLGHGVAAAFGCAGVRTRDGQMVPFKVRPPGKAVCTFLYPNGVWSPICTLDIAGETDWLRTACTQICPCGNDEWIIPFYAAKGTCMFAGEVSQHFYSITAKYRFDGEKLVFVEKGNDLESEAGRGFVEPSVIAGNDGVFHLTLRAEDGHGYCAVSRDGLHWSAPVAWHWEDGTFLEMSSTQQHWMRLGKKICLVYTRRAEDNGHLMRFRAPLFAAETDPEKGIIKKETEVIVFPRQQIEDEEALYGNFHVTQASDDHAVVSDAALFYKHDTSRLMVADVRPD